MSFEEKRNNGERFSGGRSEILIYTKTQRNPNARGQMAFPVDFNRFGMSVISDQCFQEGDEGELSITMRKHFVEKIHFVVRNIWKTGPVSRFGIEFVDVAPFQLSILMEIEQFCRNRTMRKQFEQELSVA